MITESLEKSVLETSSPASVRRDIRSQYISLYTKGERTYIGPKEFSAAFNARSQAANDALFGAILTKLPDSPDFTQEDVVQQYQHVFIPQESNRSSNLDAIQHYNRMQTMLVYAGQHREPITIPEWQGNTVVRRELPRTEEQHRSEIRTAVLERETVKPETLPGLLQAAQKENPDPRAFLPKLRGFFEEQTKQRGLRQLSSYELARIEEDIRLLMEVVHGTRGVYAYEMDRLEARASRLKVEKSAKIDAVREIRDFLRRSPGSKAA